MDFAAKPTALRRMPGNLPSERRRSGSSTPGHVRPEGTPPRKSEATQAKTAPAHASSTQEQAAVAVRCWRPSRQTRPTRRDRHENYPRPPARHGNGGNRTGPGFLGAFLGGSVRRVVAGVAGRRLLFLCAGELRGSAGNGGPVEHHSQATAGAANPRTAQEGRRGPAQKLPQASWPRRNKQETPPLAPEMRLAEFARVRLP